jgi:hypothetical protein
VSGVATLVNPRPVTSKGQLQRGKPCAAARSSGKIANRNNRLEQTVRHSLEVGFDLDVIQIPKKGRRHNVATCARYDGGFRLDSEVNKNNR